MIDSRVPQMTLNGRLRHLHRAVRGSIVHTLRGGSATSVSNALAAWARLRRRVWELTA
jgi:hypothetical protein